MNATLSRSDVLKPLAWLIGILTFSTVLLVTASAPHWLLILFACLPPATVVLYIGAYIYCLLMDRDALRSEKYSLHKMAIEHNLIGDSTVGLFRAEETLASPSGDDPTKQLEHRP